MRRLLIVLIAVFIFALGTGVVFSNENESKHSDKSKQSLSKEMLLKHPDNWVDEDLHGNYVEKYGDSKCKECHGADLNGGQDVPSCKGCHENSEEKE